MSDITTMAVAYGRLYEHYQQVHENLPDAAASARRSVWRGVSELAAAIMRSPPTDLGDIALQLGLAAAWMDIVCEGLDGDNSFAQHIGRGVETAVSNATIFLARTQEHLPVEGEALDVLNDLYAQIVVYTQNAGRVA